MGVCDCSIFCCALLCVHSSISIILMGKRGLVALLGLSSWCLVMVERLFLAVPWGCLGFVIVVFPDHTHLLFLDSHSASKKHIQSMSSSAIFFGIKDFFGKPQVQVIKTETQSQHNDENKVEDTDNLDWLQSLKQFFINVS